MIWGVNGHPLAQGQYFNNLCLQMSLLNELPAPWYRVDFNPGPVRDYSNPLVPAFFTAAASSGVNILPVIAWDSAYVFSLTPAEALPSGQATGQAFVQNYGAHFVHYYQVGNEEDLAVGGTNPNPNKAAIAFAYFTGMIQGIKAADPQAITIVNSAGNPNFFVGLAANHVPYDIIGYDFYKHADTLASDIASLTHFDKDIWLMELNEYATAGGTEDAAQAVDIDNDLETLDQQRVKAVFMYELFNEDGAGSNHDASTLGLTSWFHEFDSVTRKPVFEEYKFKIEETANGWADFVYAIYLYCNLRQPDPSGWQYWTNFLTSNRNIPQAVNTILPLENYTRWVDQQYVTLLGRAADPSGESYWTQELVNGSTRESVIESFVGGAEFWQLAGSTDSGLVNRAYMKLLGRSPNANDPDWIDKLETGAAAPWQVAQGILGSQEYQTNYVTNLYNTVLGSMNLGTPSNIAYWVGQMQSGMNQLDVFKSFLNSYPFYRQAIQQGYDRNHQGYTF